MPPQPRVLMIEDHPDIADLYQLKLQLEGYRVAVAADGVSGLEMARSLKPDVTLLDVHMPYLDRLKQLSSLRGVETRRDLLVVVYSEDVNPTLVEEGKRH